MMLPLAQVTLWMNVLIGLFIAIALFLVLIILIQKGKGGGMGAMFGGLGASSLLGSKTGDFLTWVTITLVALFLVLAVLMDKYFKNQLSASRITPTSQSQPQQPSEETGTTIPEAPAEGTTEGPAEMPEQPSQATPAPTEPTQASPVEQPAQEPAQ